MEIFGFSIKKKGRPDDKKGVIQVVPPTNNDGALEVMQNGPLGGHFVELYNSGVVGEDEYNLIKKYRQMSECTEVDKAVSEIVNDAITYEDNVPFPVKISLDNVEKLSDSVKTKIADEFENILYLLKFNDYGYDLFKNWYVDGRIYFHTIIDKNRIKDGIQKISYIDPLFIKKIRNIVKDGEGKIQDVEEFYVYKPPALMENAYQGMSNYSHSEQAIKFTKDSVTYGTSGIMDADRKMIISYLHKALKPANQLGMLEDAVVIYRVSRAPERRIFYIDVGNLPKTKAEEYLNAVMNRYRNKIAYNTATGEVDEEKQYMSMLEDYWLPRREGGRGTEIDTLSGAQNLGEMDDVNYFRHKLYESLNVPIGRMDGENSMFNLGKDNEITREEIKFSKFIQRIRTKFARSVFSDLLYKQLILKRIITTEDWDNIEAHIIYAFEEDSHFAELKKLAMIKERIDAVEGMDQMIERYYSMEYIRSNILLQTEEEAKELAKQRDNEKEERDSTSAFSNAGANFGGEYQDEQLPPEEPPPEEDTTDTTDNQDTKDTTKNKETTK